MTEKRFEMVIVDVQGNFYYLDKVTDEKISSTLALEDKLNELAEENEELKNAIIGKIQYDEDLEKFAVEKGLIKKDWARFDDYD